MPSNPLAFLTFSTPFSLLLSLYEASALAATGDSFSPKPTKIIVERRIVYLALLECRKILV